MASHDCPTASALNIAAGHGATGAAMVLVMFYCDRGRRPSCGLTVGADERLYFHVAHLMGFEEGPADRAVI